MLIAVIRHLTETLSLDDEKFTGGVMLRDIFHGNT